MPERREKRRSPVRYLRSGARGLAIRAGWHARPSFLIVGAQKAGTTALHEYLSRHPQLVPAKEKEIGFFCPEMVRTWTGHRHHRLFSRLDREWGDSAVRREGLRWYHAQFPLPRPGRAEAFYESTPEYLYFPRVPARIRAYRPDMKLIVLLRDPVERAFSSWNMQRGFAEPTYLELRETREFEDAVRQEIAQIGRTPERAEADYVRRGLYHDQLRRFLDCFPREQLLILESRELRDARAATLARVCHFLGVPEVAPDDDWPPVFIGSYEGEMPQAARNLLTEFYRPHNARLFELIGRAYDWSE